jgi:Ni/Co efflux regulator RcnB
LKRNAILPAILAASLALAGGPAFAQGPRDNRQQRPDYPQRMGPGGAPHQAQRPAHPQGIGPGGARPQAQRPAPRDRRYEARPGVRINTPPGGEMHDSSQSPPPRGAGPDHQFRRGDRLPREYRDRVYVVDDWRGHHLSAPPRGYHWVQVGSDYVLVAIATGIILQLLLSN